MARSIAELLVRFRYFWAFLAVVILLATAVGSKNLFYNSDYKSFFRDDDPQLLAYESMEDTYTKSDNVGIVFGLKDSTNGDLFQPKYLAAIEDLTQRMWKFPLSIRVDSITNHQHSEAAGFELKVYPLFENAAEMSKSTIAERKKIALDEPLLVDQLVSRDGRAVLINTRILLPRSELPENPTLAERKASTERLATATKTLVEEATAIREELRAKYPEAEVHIIGVPIVNGEFAASSIRDFEGLVPLMFLTILLLSGILLRSIVATLSVLVLILFSVPAAMGTAGWIGIELDQISVTAPLIIMTLCVCDAIHVLSSYLNLQREGMEKQEARINALETNMQPVLLTSVTTTVGFLGLNFSDSPPFHSWGNITAMGVMFAWLFSLMLLPALMGLIKAKPAEQKQGRGFNKLADFVLAKRTALFWGGLIVAVLLSAGASRNELTDSTYQYFDHGVPLRDAAEFVETRLTGFDNVVFSLDSGEDGGISNPEYLQQVEAFAVWARKQPYVAHVASYTDVIKRLNKNLNEDDEAFYVLPPERPLAVEAHTMYEFSLPFGMDMNNIVNFDKSATRMDVTLRNVKAKQIVEFETAAQQWLEANAPQIKSPGSSVSVMFAHIGQNNIMSMLLGSGIALLAISATLILALRSFRLGLLSLIPNTFPALIAMGIWGYWVAEVNLAVAAIFSITLGIVVDDTVHFLSKYLRARRDHGASAEESVRYAFNKVGSALLVTTLAIGLGFLILSASSFQVNSLTGLLTALTIGIALVFDMLFLPTLLIKTDRWLKLGAPPKSESL